MRVNAKFLPLCVFALGALFFVPNFALAGTTFVSTTTSSVTIPYEDGDIVTVWLRQNSVGYSSDVTFAMQKDGVNVDTVLSNPGSSSDSESLMLMYSGEMGTASSTVFTYSNDGGQSPTNVRWLYAVSNDSGAGGGTTEFEWDSSVIAFNLTLTYFFFAILWIVVFLLMLFLVRKLTD